MDDSVAPVPFGGVRRKSIIYVVGWERSGTTLLGAILGQAHGAFDAGELSQLWNRARKSDLCGCGLPLSGCPFWTEVERLLPGHELLEPPRRAADLRDRFASFRRTLPMVLGLRSRRGRALLSEFSALLGEAYTAVGTTSQARVIVDTSKVPAMIPALDLMDDFDVFYVHLVRDPRGVVHSGARRRYSDMRRGTLQNVSRWILWNLAAERLRRTTSNPWIRLRYEDLSTDPSRAVREISKIVPGLRGFDLSDQLVDGDVVFAENHTVQGNPARFKKGPVTVRPDDEWIEALSFGKWVLTTVLTCWMLPRYGYRLLRGRVRLDEGRS